MRGEKTALKIAYKYRENVEKGVEAPVRELNELLDILAQYQNKSGTISKSKTRSKRSQKLVKETLKELNKKYKTQKSRKAAAEKYAEDVAKTAATLEKTLGLSGSKGRAAAEVFINKTKNVINVINESEIVLALARAGFSSRAIEDVLQYLHYQISASVPDEMRKFITEDDIWTFISNMENLKETYPDLDTADMINIADQMQTYGFDNVEDAYENYFKDEDDSWGAMNEDDEEDLY